MTLLITANGQFKIFEKWNFKNSLSNAPITENISKYVGNVQQYNTA